MDIYYFLVFFLLIAFLLSWKNYKVDRVLFLFLSVLVVAIVAFRYKTIGMDTMNYLYFFQNPHRGYTDGRTIDEMEPAYTLLNFIIRFISLDEAFFIFIMSLLSLVPIMVGIYKYSQYKTFSLLLFVTAGTMLCFYVYYFSMIRQCLAISCLYMAVYSLMNNGMKFTFKVFFLIGLGICFHYSSAVALPFFLIYRWNIRPKFYLILLFISILLAVTSNILHLSSYIDLIYRYTGRNLNFYFDSSKIEGANYMAFIPTSLLALYIYIYCDENVIKNIFVKIFSYGVLINNVFSQLMPTNSDRFVLFYMLALVWVLPLVARDKKILSYLRFGISIICILYFTYKFNVVLNYYEDNRMIINGITPYKSVLFR